MRYQLAIIGGGPAGYTAAEAAGKAGLSVVLFEKKSLGGVQFRYFQQFLFIINNTFFPNITNIR